MLRRIRIAFAAKKLLREVHKVEKQMTDSSLETVRPEWDATKTQQKATSAAKVTGISVLATGGPVAALLALVRVVSPDFLPWPESGDAGVVVSITTIVG